MELTLKNAGKVVCLLNATVRVPYANSEDEEKACLEWLSKYNSAYSDATYENLEAGYDGLFAKAMYDATIFGYDRPYPDLSDVPEDARLKYYSDTVRVWDETFGLTAEEKSKFEPELKKELLLD